MKNNILIAVIALSALLSGYWFSTLQQEAESDAASSLKIGIQGAVINPARKVGVPALVKHDDTILTESDFKGHWSLVFFGYTHCPDVCPTTMNVLTQAKKIVSESAADEVFPTVYFVSVDPARDDPQQLAGYVSYFDKEFIGVTGEEPLLNAFTLQLSAVYLLMPPDDPAKPDVYNVDHSSALYLLNPDGRLTAMLSEPFTPQKLVEDIGKVRSAFGD